MVHMSVRCTSPASEALMLVVLVVLELVLLELVVLLDWHALGLGIWGVGFRA